MRESIGCFFTCTDITGCDTVTDVERVRESIGCWSTCADITGGSLYTRKWENFTIGDQNQDFTKGEAARGLGGGNLNASFKN